FMFSRFCLPVTPAMFLGWQLLASRSNRLGIICLAAIVVGTWQRPNPALMLMGSRWDVVEEKTFYPDWWVASAEQIGNHLRESFADVDLRITIRGGQAMLAYYTDVSVAVELGCGLGLVSIALAAFGWKVTATDNEPTALDFARHNAQLNAVDSIKFETLDWHDPPKDRHFDRVLAADVLYQLVDHAPLIACIRELLSPSGVAMIADPNRGVADRFESTARSSGFDVEVFDAEAARPDAKQTKGRIYHLYYEQGG
ncbi:MAG: methyltransferase domain-containing protein, partial [Planctomycetes bacterium]|nr:methyltransferase domain-containing protein [Planctomycetota bacterium]